MGHAVRVIARLDIKGPNLIKGVQFDGHRVLGTAEQFGELYYREGIDELIYQDAVASLYRRNSLLEIIKKTAMKVFVPLTVAGGIRTIEDIRQILRAGADKVAINTGAVENPALLSEAVKVFGSQCIVSSIEAFRISDGKYQVWVDYGREVTGLDAIEWAKQVEGLGVGEILLTSINSEGMGEGYDIELTNRISSIVSIPVIASGGAGTKSDLSKVIRNGGAQAAAAASIFHYNYATPVNKPFMSFSEARLRMGEHIDSGNVDFLNHGYGGERACTVKPASIREVKEDMVKNGIEVRI
ncbi:MAG: imidazole glycerol phosphate synthase subunit HisF [Candidatus Omnitrophica bacterium]|nr:imidazole glycerol phosphate synthase subunit HisF [Candidatus Omnitrophota bacterium]